jgi:hypothetical protein
MSILITFRPKSKTEIEYDKRAYLMIRGYKEGKPELSSNSADLRDLDCELAKQGEK